MTIIGLEEGGGGKESDCDSGNLSILLRLQGPEALALVRTFHYADFRSGLGSGARLEKLMLLGTFQLIDCRFRFVQMRLPTEQTSGINLRTGHRTGFHVARS